MSRTIKECYEEFLVYLENVRGLSPNSVKGYRMDFVHLEQILGADTAVDQVTLSDLRFCLGHLTKTDHCATSVNRFIAAVRGLFAYCRKFNYIPVNPAVNLKTVKAPKNLPAFMTSSEIDTMCALPDKKNLLWAQRDKALFEMLYSSGCRVSEIASLKFSDMSLDRGSAVVTGKGSKDRRVYFEADARKALETYLEDRRRRFPQHEKDGAFPVDHVFINQKGTPLTAHGVWFIVSRYSGPEGTNRQISPHAFRHTFATAMLNNGADIRSVQELLGHASISTTQRYTHVTVERLKTVYSQAFPHSGKKD
ncbi:MAG: tyrosine-type recombinase/integrase [Treponema sp.]|nr:tyrosine-type recombinase/integrase [Treponema sp.]